MNYYINDTTLTPPKIVTFDTFGGILTYLNEVSIRKFNQTRRQRMLVLEELGHGNDDPKGVNFVRAMAESFSMGIVRENRYVRCDITSVENYQKEEYGS